MTRDTIKHAIMSVLVGALVAFLSALFQGALEFLRVHHSEIGGAVAGMLNFNLLWRTNRIV